MPAKIAIIQFPGSNCEREAILAVTRVGMDVVPFLWNADPALLTDCDGYLIVGGFSYEDRSRAGIIAAGDPVLSAIRKEADKGKPVIGICNGAQILVETAMVPGAEDNTLSMALTINKRVQDGKVLGTGYYNAWVNVCVGKGARPNAFNRYLKASDTLNMPVAHGEGRYVMPAETLKAMQDKGLIAFQYCDDNANVVDEFPTNPNGSMASIAGIINTRGNVLSLMPHPERTPACDAIFASMRDYIAQGQCAEAVALPIKSITQTLRPLEAKRNTTTFVVDLLITDKEAVTVENALNQAGIPVYVKRQTHWAVEADQPDAVRNGIIKSGELFNANKERLSDVFATENTESVLVRHKDNVVGMNKMQLLGHHFSVKGIESISHGVLWHITANEGYDIVELMPKVLETNILYNPFGQEGFSVE